MSAGFAIDVPAQRESTYGIYVDGEPDRLELVVDHLRATLARDRRRIAAPIAAWLGSEGAHRFRVVPKNDGPALPSHEILEALGLDAMRALALERASHVVLLATTLTPTVPRVALWGGFALASAMARAYEAVLYDSDAMRVVGPALANDPLAGADEESVASTIMVLQSTGNDGVGSLTTMGLQRYGIPDLAFEGVPALAVTTGRLSVLVNAVAQWLVDETAATPGRRWVPGIVTIDAARFARANGRAEYARTSALIDVALAPGAEHGGFVMLGAPPGTADVLAWLERGLGPLGFAPTAATALARSGDPEMDDAMARARAQLATAKTAFNDRGELTYVKRRFETRDGRAEYIWIAVDRWTGSSIVGRLANAPLGDVGYALDRRIEFDERDVDDWIVSARDGSRSGNFTGAVLERREGSRPRGA